MCIKNSVPPQANIYSSKILFDKLEDRNQKRIAQIVRRKNALLSKNKNHNTTTKDKSSDQMITPSTQEISTNTNNNNLDISKSYIKKENYYQKILSSSNPPVIERFLSSFKIKNKTTNSVNLSNNFNIADEDLSEKEVNISNLNDSDNCFDYINEKEKSKNKIKKNNFNEKNTQNENNNNLTKNEDKIQKETNNICQRNKFAIEFLSSSLDSFIELKNKLVRKAKYNKNYFTLSYSQALFLDNNSNYNWNYTNTDYHKYEKDRFYNYEVNDIIKEENESYSPKTNNNLYIDQSTTMRYVKRKNNKTTIKINNKMPSKSFCKTADNYISGNKCINIKNYNFNKKTLINNCKLKIPKIKLSIELKNKKKIFDNINNNNNGKCKNNLEISQNHKEKEKEEKILSPKLLELKPFIEENKNKKDKENNRYSNKYKNKSKKILKRVKLKI